jgi:hypothetical protein
MPGKPPRPVSLLGASKRLEKWSLQASNAAFSAGSARISSSVALLPGAARLLMAPCRPGGRSRLGSLPGGGALAPCASPLAIMCSTPRAKDSGLPPASLFSSSCRRLRTGAWPGAPLAAALLSRRGSRGGPCMLLGWQLLPLPLPLLKRGRRSTLPLLLLACLLLLPGWQGGFKYGPLQPWLAAPAVLSLLPG